MAIFETLDAKNALSYRDLHVNFDKQGLVLIDGAVGAGKSSLFNIATHVLYGQTPNKGIKDNAILNRYVVDESGPVGYRGIVQFRHRDHTYRVDQKRRFSEGGGPEETGVSVMEDGVVIDRKKGRSKNLDTQADVAGKVGMSLREFYGGVYLSQGYTHDLIVGTPAERSQYLIRYFGIDLIDRLIVHVGEQVASSALDADLSSHDAKLEVVDAELAQYRSGVALSALEDQKDIELADLNVAVAEKQAAWADGRSLRQSYLTYKVARDARDQHACASLGIEAVNKELGTLRVQQARLTEQVERVTRNSEIVTKLARERKVDNLDELRHLLQDLQHVKTTYEREAPVLAKLEALRTSVSDQPVEWDDDADGILGTTREKLSVAKASLSSLETELAKLQALGDVCFTCLRPVGADEKQAWVQERLSVVTATKKTIERLSATYQVLVETKTSFDADRKLRDQIAHLESTLSGQGVVDVASLKADIATLTDAAASHVRYLELEARLSSVDDVLDLTEIEQLRSRWAKRIELLQQYVGLCGQVGEVVTAVEQSAVDDLEKELNDLKSRQAATQTELGTVRSELSTVQRLDRSRAQIVEDRDRASAKAAKHRVLHTLHLSLKDIRRLRLHDSAELLAQRLPMYLKTLFHGEDIRVDVDDEEDSFDLVLYKTNASIPLAGLSGGQKAKLGLAVLFAFTRLVNRQSNMLVLDEPYTNLDARSRAACYEILRDLLGTDQSLTSIFVMSHEQDLKNQRFDQRWYIDYDGRFSTLRT